MCLGIPGKSSNVQRARRAEWARSISAASSNGCAWPTLPDAQIGQYVIVHVGFALQVIDEAEAQQVFTFLNG